MQRRPIKVEKISKEEPFTEGMYKGIGMCIGAAVLIEQAGIFLKSDNEFYKTTNKNLLNRLLDNNLSIIFSIDRFKNMHDFNDGDLEANLTLEQELFIKFVSIYIQSSESDLYNLHLYLSNFEQKKKLYTKEEVFDIMRKLQTTLHPSVEYNDNFFETYLT